VNGAGIILSQKLRKEMQMVKFARVVRITFRQQELEWFEK
jgi:hypothetical protein